MNWPCFVYSISTLSGLVGFSSVVGVNVEAMDADSWPTPDPRWKMV